MDSKKLKSNLLLLFTAMIWGASFVFQDLAAENGMGAFIFNSSRSFLACLALIPVSIIFSRNAKKRGEIPPESTPKGKRDLILGGILCGVALTAASAFQQLGMSYTTPGKAGFITSLYIILVPIASIFLKKKPHYTIWISAVLGVIGLYFLCMNGELRLQYGDMLILICAFGYTLHILVIDYFSPKTDGIKMSCIQFLTTGVLSFILSVLIGEKPFSHIALFGNFEIISSVVYAGIMSSAVGYTLQIVAQKNTSAGMASLLLSLESVFSVLSGWILLSQALSFREIIGCVLMFTAIILAQFPDIFGSRQKTS